MNKFTHTLLLLWKNFMLQLRHPWITAVELLIPFICSAIFIILRSFSGRIVSVADTLFEAYNISTLPKVKDQIVNSEIYHCPRSTFLNKVMSDSALMLNITSIGFDNEVDMVTAYKKESSNAVAGIVFDEQLKFGVHTAGAITYKIRPKSIPGYSWHIGSVFREFDDPGRLNIYSVSATYYMELGFLTVQHAVAVNVLKNVLADLSGTIDTSFLIQMERYPYPPYEFDSLYFVPEYYFAIGIFICFLYPSSNIAKNIVHEKETGLKGTMKMMGLAIWVNWLAWFIKYLILFAIFSCIITLMMCIKFTDHAVFNACNPFVILVWLLLYSSSIISFSFFTTTLFSKANLAVGGTCVLFILSFMPYIHLLDVFHEMSLPLRLLFCLLPNSLMPFSIRTIIRSELLGYGLQWHSLQHVGEIGSGLHMGTVFIAFIVDTIIYLILTLYIEELFPGKFGIQQPWYFPLTLTYWTGHKRAPSSSSGPLSRLQLSSEYFEKDPPRSKPILDIKNLKKVYRKTLKPAVNNITLKAYKGQITVLLGHDGAGKTTTVSMLHGALSPTSGTAVVKGYDISVTDDVRKVIPLLGICSDNDALFQELNVEENLYFFCKLKGFASSGMQSELTHIMSALDLEIKSKTLVETLPPSWKRKISVGIALIGESEVVIMDEPTSRMDTKSRRIVWDCLRAEKKTRTIFLTSCHIKEAYALGDRIAVMENGELQCCGSAQFLKKKYRGGYQLTISTEPECNISLLTSLIFSHIPDASLVSCTESELKCLLPHECRHLYHPLLCDLEEKDLKITSFNIAETSLNELFDKISVKVPPMTIRGTDKAKMSLSEALDKATKDLLSGKRNEGCTLFRQHVSAFLQKHYLFSTRNIILSLSQLIILPLILVLSNVIHQSKQEEMKSQNLNLLAFHGTKIPYGVKPSIMFSVPMADVYGTLINAPDVPEIVDTDEESFLSYLLKIGKTNAREYDSRYIIGAEFSHLKGSANIIAYYNSEAYHSAPISLHYVHNALLKYYTKGSGHFILNVTNHPLPFKTLREKSVSAKLVSESSFWAQDVLLGMSIIMSGFVVFIVFENATHSKRLQITSGLSAFSYWFSSFIYDFCIYSLSCLLLLLIFINFETECMSSFFQIGCLVVLFIFHGLPALLFTYCCAFFSHSPSSAYIGTFLSYMLGIFLLFLVYKLEIASEFYVSELLDILFSLLSPSYCLGRGFSNLYRNCKTNEICNQPEIQNLCNSISSQSNLPQLACCIGKCGNDCIPWNNNFFAWSLPGIGRQLAFLVLVQPLIFIITLILSEVGVFQTCKLRKNAKPKKRKQEQDSKKEKDLDENVKMEKDNILKSTMSKLTNTNYLILKEISKYYGTKLVVDELTLGVRRGETFGFIGIDGGGKSTVLKMVHGEESISSGIIYVDGYNILKNPHKIQDKIGVCPEYDAFVGYLTGKETLTLYSHIRGIPQNVIPRIISSLSFTLSLDIYMHIKVRDYSCATKRRLSIAIAIIGTPPLIILDEPTTRMDPASCRCAWNALMQAAHLGCTLLLSTKRMDECEALCDRIGIIVKGELTYIGSLNDLKNRFSDGFTLVLKLIKTRQTRQAITAKGGVDEVKTFIEDLIPDCVLKIEYQTFLNFFVPYGRLKWSKMFSTLEKAKKYRLISDYAISETNLEQIFIYHALSKDESKEKKITDFLKERMVRL